MTITRSCPLPAEPDPLDLLPPVVTMPVTEAAVRDALHLPTGVRLAGASVEHGADGGGTLVLYLEWPGAWGDKAVPRYAASAVPVNVLDGITWYRGGFEIDDPGR